MARLRRHFVVLSIVFSLCVPQTSFASSARPAPVHSASAFDLSQDLKIKRTNPGVSHGFVSRFIGNSTRLSFEQRNQVTSALELNPSLDKITCTGLRLSSQSRALNTQVRQRAENLCKFAKTLRPSLNIVLETRIVSRRTSSGLVQVLLSNEGPAIPNVDSGLAPESMLGQEPQILGTARPQSALTLKPGVWKNASVDPNQISWQLCKASTASNSLSKSRQVDTNVCSFSRSGINYTLPQKSVIVNNGSKFVRVTFTVITGQGSNRIEWFATLEKPIIDAEYDPITNTSAPTISGIAEPGSTLKLDKGTWANGEPESSIAYWFLCDTTSSSLSIVDESNLAHPPGCAYFDSADLPMRVPATGDARLSGKKTIRALFLVSGPQASGQYKTVVVETRLINPQPISPPVVSSPVLTTPTPGARFALVVRDVSRSLAQPDSEQVTLNYTITNNSSVSIRESTLSIFDSQRNVYRPVGFSNFETQLVPPGVSITRQLVWQLRTTIGRPLRVGLYENATTPIEDLRNSEIMRISNVRTSTTPNGVLVSWDPVSTYADGTPLANEGSVRYFTETSVAGSQTQRIYYESPQFFTNQTANGLTVKVWVLGRQSVSKPVEFSVFGTSVFLVQ